MESAARSRDQFLFRPADQDYCSAKSKCRRSQNRRSSRRFWVHRATTTEELTMIRKVIGSRSASGLAAALLLTSAPMFAADDDVMRAMRDELARSMRKL